MQRRTHGWGGKNQIHNIRQAPLVIFAVTNTAGQQHLHEHNAPFLEAWNAAKITTQGNQGTPTPLKRLQPPNNSLEIRATQAPKRLQPLLNKTGKI
jgi:hypothetical protein